MRETTCIVLLLEKGKVTIPHEIRKYLSLKRGDLVKLSVVKANGD